MSLRAYKTIAGIIDSIFFSSLGEVGEGGVS